MRKKNLAICDKDEAYVHRLSELLAIRDSFPFQIAVYKESAQLLNPESQQGKSLDLKNHRDSDSENQSAMEVLLISVSEYEKLLSDSGKPNLLQDTVTILLDDGKQDIAFPMPIIYKFQSGEIIRKEILEIYGKAKGNELCSQQTGRKQAKIVGVYSPVGRCGQTSFCLLLGQILAKKKKVLYLNFEPLSGLSSMMNIQEKKDITDLIYAMHGDGSRLQFQMESMISNINGLDYITPAGAFPDLAGISADDWIIMLEALKSGGIYDYVILDLTEMVQGLLEVLHRCQMIYTIIRKDGFALAKINQYELLLRNYDYEDVMTKTRKCELPVFKKLPDGIDQLPYSEMAGYIKNMVSEEPEFM